MLRLLPHRITNAVMFLLSFILGLQLICITQVQSVIYLEDYCVSDEFQNLNITIHELLFPEISHTEHLKVTRNGSYVPGKNCTILLISEDDVILSLQKIQFRPGCQDYLKVNILQTAFRNYGYAGTWWITNYNQIVGLCGFKNEMDSNMQFYGKHIYLNYFTEAGGPPTIGLIGFSLSITLSRKKSLCNSRYGYQCDNGYCIHKKQQCDGTNNCGDFSDENNCGSGDSVILIAMFLVTIMGLVGGFSIAVCFSAICQDIYKLFNPGLNESTSSYSCCSSDSAQICISCF